MTRKTQGTGYWTFLCNPNEWEVENFLNDLKNEKISRFDSWTITKWQYDYFKPGQYGIIRVGVDKRTKTKLNGRRRLESGVYAIVRVLSAPKHKIERIGHRDKYYANKESSFIKSEYYVEIEYITNLITLPLTFDLLKDYEEITNDKYLIPGFQASTIPLSEDAFRKLVVLSNTKLIDSDNDIEMYLSNNLKETEKEAVIKTRIGQSEIRTKLLSKECKCKICGLEDKRYLIASHIKPWSESDNFEKVDINNVFLLCPNHDALFDKGYISFDDNGKIIISESISEKTKVLMNITDNITIDINNQNKVYLNWHRNHMK